jgi:hypothetical protein
VTSENRYRIDWLWQRAWRDASARVFVGLQVRDARLLRGQLSDGRLPQAYDEDVKTDETEASEAFPKATTGKELATERVSMSRNPYRSSRKEIKDQPRWRSVVT